MADELATCSTDGAEGRFHQEDRVAQPRACLKVDHSNCAGVSQA